MSMKRGRKDVGWVMMKIKVRPRWESSRPGSYSSQAYFLFKP